MDEPISIDEVLASMCAMLRGIHLEIRAMRLELQDARGTLTADDADELLAAQVEAGDVAAMFNDVPDDMGEGAQA